MSPHKYLNTFSRYQLDGYCLAILFSNKVFAGKVLGLSWRGNNETRAGICQSRTNVASEGQDPEMLNLNSLFITMRTRHIKRIPLQMGVLNLAHEVCIKVCWYGIDKVWFRFFTVLEQTMTRAQLSVEQDT